MRKCCIFARFGVAPYTIDKFRQNFRLNFLFHRDSTRARSTGSRRLHTPVFPLPGAGPVPPWPGAHRDIALIQTSPPDEHGYLSLGVSVDIVKAAIEASSLVIAQVNSNMPRVHGDAFIHIGELDHIIEYNEPILEYSPGADTETARRIGNYVARLIQDGDTIQVGYGSIPNAVLANLAHKKNLGVHTELMTDGIVELMKAGVIDNSRKNIDRGKTVATFCMGKKSTYDFIHDNPVIEFKTIDYTNDPMIIAQIKNMVAINSALEIDLTGQATAESIGTRLYSGIGGQADFMRGAALAGGRTILTLPSTAANGVISRIVPALKEGAGATLIRAMSSMSLLNTA